jgi:predicted aspartyl protease
MGFIQKKITIKGDKGSKVLDVLVDTGAKQSFIVKEKAEEICDIRYFDEPRDITLADGVTKVKDVGYCPVETIINGKPIYDEMDVLDMPKVDNKPDMFLGAQTLEKFNLNVIMRKGKGNSYIDTSDYDSAFYLF